MSSTAADVPMSVAVRPIAPVGSQAHPHRKSLCVYAWHRLSTLLCSLWGLRVVNHHSGRLPLEGWCLALLFYRSEGLMDKVVML